METTSTTNEAGTVSRYVREHGTFTATAKANEQRMSQSRAYLVKRLCSVYEGCQAHGGKGDKPSHWRAFPKADLALIVADTCGEFPISNESVAAVRS
jgi:hypothetical protein